MAALAPDVAAALDRARGGRIVFLTGAGISAESGVPTFRGHEGYWLVGSRNYHPQELARRSAFEELPDAVWAWYLYRRGVCRGASPNAAHRALAELEGRLQNRFVLVTQNVDGLHHRAGNTLLRTLEIHGNVDFMRCAADCARKRVDALIPMPDAIPVAWPKDREVDDAVRALLRCPRCGERTRPHVLWFDEHYDEELFRAQSALSVAREAQLLVVVGTTLQTSLPARTSSRARRLARPRSSRSTSRRASSGQSREARAGARSSAPRARPCPRSSRASRSEPSSSSHGGRSRRRLA